MINNYLKAISIVNKKYKQEDNYYPLFVLGLYSLLNKYPNYHNIIEDIFINTNIYLENSPIKDILIKHNLEEIDSFSKENFNNETSGMSSQGHNFYLDENNKVCTGISNPFIVCNTDCNNTILLNIFIHEMNHLIKGYKNGYVIYQDDEEIHYTIRNGLNIYEYNYVYEEDTLYETDYYDTLDEVINTLQTTEMLEDILFLDGIIDNSTIQNFIDSIDKEQVKHDFGYENVTKLFKPLWQNTYFKELIENNIVEGNISIIENEFNSIMGKDTLLNLADILDDLDEIDSFNNKKERDKMIIHLKSIIKRWNKLTKQKSFQK